MHLIQKQHLEAFRKYKGHSEQCITLRQVMLGLTLALVPGSAIVYGTYLIYKALKPKPVPVKEKYKHCMFKESIK